MAKSSSLRLIIILLLTNFNLLLAQKDPSESLNLKTVFNWHNLDSEADKINGISTEKAYEMLLKNKKSKTVTVAIIDSGVEIDHIELHGKIWVNEKEIKNNGIDDDGNGYIDDINGWDFLGNSKGEDLSHESLELTREYVKFGRLIENIDPTKATKEEKEQIETYKNLKQKYEKRLEEIENQGGRYYLQLYENFKQAQSYLISEFKVEKITTEILDQISLVSSEKLQRAKKIYKILEEVNLDEESLYEGYDHFNSLINYGLNEDFDGRKEIVGDNPMYLNELGYGNNEVEGPDAKHGTHVAGIVAANRENNIGTKGIGNDIKIMAIRAVPDGDERDKDVANAIRYAASNGAQVINMSFGKPYSPNKEYVDEAIKFAESKGVLMIHGAGNDNLNLDNEKSFPNKFYSNGDYCKTWLDIGAISWKTGNDLVAEFSNYGHKTVDVFAPGVDIYSLGIEGKYKEMSGTSMAAPVVTGLAALLMSYYPQLTAVQIIDILMNSSTKLGNREVYIPGKTSTTAFKNLSVSGGIVNTYNAILLADKITNN
ncbi:MAG: S8 family peptidase [Bacteroidota bacterium]